MLTKTIHKSQPVRESLLPYGQPCLDDDDIAAVVAVLKSDWLTTGPQVERFEQAFAAATGAAHAVAISNGTAALHACMNVLDIGPGDEVIVSPMTFAASANCILYQGATPVFADVEPDTLLLDAKAVEAKISPATRAIIAVDYAGQPCDYTALQTLADRHGLTLVADACHSLGASYKGRAVGTLSALNCFSLHPVKPITSGEGGMITTDNAQLAQRLRVFRNHGITTDHRQRSESGAWFYEMQSLGFNYRMTDIQCALGNSQLAKLARFTQRRHDIAAHYHQAFKALDAVEPLRVREQRTHAYHLYVIRVAGEREYWYRRLRELGIGCNVHYVPVHWHPYYQQRLGTRPGLCPVAEAAYTAILSLPIFPRMTDSDRDDVIGAVTLVAEELSS